MKKRKKKDEKDDKNLLFDFQFPPSPALQKTVPPGEGEGGKNGTSLRIR